MMKKQNNKKNWKKIFIFSILIFITYFILLTSVTPKKYNLVKGDIASEDIKATRDIVDEEATKVKENEARELVPKQFSLKTDVKIEASQNITDFFNKLINLKSSEDDEVLKITSLKKLGKFTLSDTQYKALLGLSVEKDTEIQRMMLNILDTIYADNISEDNDKNLESAKEVAKEKILNAQIDENIKSIIIEMINNEIKPNYVEDTEKREELIKEALKSVEKVMIKKNQTIVKEGEPITEKQIQILTELGIVGDYMWRGSLVTYIIIGILVITVFILEYFIIKKEVEQNYKISILILLLNIITLILCFSLRKISIFIIPISCVPIIMAVLINYRISLLINIINLILVSIIVEFNPQFILMSILSIIVVVNTLKKANQRNDILYSTVYVGIVASIVVFTTGMLLSSDISVILKNAGFAGISSIVSGILAVGMLPFLESSFNITTNMSLLELANPNNPLLKRLLMEAPGTYHHSIMVANLAEVAAEEINANSAIVRVGAYYHDIGKIIRPLFFGENQIGQDNPHNRINPNLSASLIISHVKDGGELADEYKLPKVIKDVILEHHGTTLVKYFYFTAKKNADNPDDVKKEDFRYDGPIPSSREAGIVMLADSVEAAVRSIKEPTTEKIEDMVNNIISDKLNSHQLYDCELTLKDIATIKKCFLKVLNGLYHKRVEYPKEEK
ncbi:MAG: HDIG domain-containing protein [Clostridium sp.]|nr:HDIG domain-containing protein [Clostridium sp.]